MTSYREADRVQTLPRHLRGSTWSAKSGATAGETALGSPRLDARAFLKPAGHYFRDTCLWLHAAKHLAYAARGCGEVV